MPPALPEKQTLPMKYSQQYMDTTVYLSSMKCVYICVNSFARTTWSQETNLLPSLLYVVYKAQCFLPVIFCFRWPSNWISIFCIFTENGYLHANDVHSPEKKELPLEDVENVVLAQMNRNHLLWKARVSYSRSYVYRKTNFFSCQIVCVGTQHVCGNIPHTA